MADRGTVSGLGPRRAALALLEAVLGEGRLMAEVLSDPAGPFFDAPPEERARAQRLALSVLRHVEPADRLLSPHLRKTPPLAVLNAMRLALVEIHAEGAAAHGAVNAAVDIVRRGKRTGALAGLVNAVLRKAGADAAGWAKQPPQRLAPWLRKPLVDLYARPAVSAMEAVQAAPAPLDLTLRDPATAAHWAEALGAEILSTGSLRRRAPGQVSELPGYGEGAWWVQDAAAALAAKVAAPVRGARVLDLCAAPGGKTLQLAAAGAEVTALDISGPRLARLEENLARCELAAQVVVADALHWQPEAPFDSVLLDAPCSATGTIRRHPDLPFVKDGTEVAALADLQARLIDRALGWVRPGGTLTFCTCSLLPEEGEAQLAGALARHPDLILDMPALPGEEAGWRAPGGGLRLRPDFWAGRGGMDGFFIARIRRPG